MERRLSRFALFLRALIAFGGLFLAGEARAMTVAPMCDEAGASVVAPIPALPNATGELRASTTCDHEGEALRAAPPTKGRASLQSAFDPDQRVCGALFTLAPPPSRALPVPKPDRIPAAPEHRDSVYRPPRD